MGINTTNKEKANPFGIEPNLRVRVEKDLGIRIDNLSDLAKPELPKAAADYLCRDKAPKYLGNVAHHLDNLGSVVFHLLEDGEVGKSPPDNSKEQAIWWDKITKASFSHTQPFALSLAMELSGRCPVSPNPPSSFAEWKAHLVKATNATSKQYSDSELARRDFAVEAVDILLHTPPGSRSEMLKTLIAEARNVFGKITYKDSGESLREWDIILHTESFSQDIIGNLVSRIKESPSRQTASTKRKVSGVLGENKDKAA